MIYSGFCDEDDEGIVRGEVCRAREMDGDRPRREFRGAVWKWKGKIGKLQSRLKYSGWTALRSVCGLWVARYEHNSTRYCVRYLRGFEASLFATCADAMYRS
jgi:hypothetical protein